MLSALSLPRALRDGPFNHPACVFSINIWITYLTLRANQIAHTKCGVSHVYSEDADAEYLSSASSDQPTSYTPTQSAVVDVRTSSIARLNRTVVVYRRPSVSQVVVHHNLPHVRPSLSPLRPIVFNRGSSY